MSLRLIEPFSDPSRSTMETELQLTPDEPESPRIKSADWRNSAPINHKPRSVQVHNRVALDTVSKALK